MQIEINHEPVKLLTERAVYLVREKTLLVSDLHWGKSDVFSRSGIQLPQGILSADLKRLQKAIQKTSCEKILVLGDLVHNAKVLSSELHDEVASWRIENPVEMVLVPGNHDRGLAVYGDWNIAITEASIESEKFIFCHDHQRVERSGKFTWGGHIHPMMRMRGGGDTFRCPCFMIGPTQGLLPAFGRFTGGIDVVPHRDDRVFVIADDEIVAL